MKCTVKGLGRNLRFGYDSAEETVVAVVEPVGRVGKLAELSRLSTGFTGWSKNP
jgi:hypothetical protein